MIIYDQTTLAFIQKTESMIREILVALGFEVRRTRFIVNKYLYPIQVVVFEGKEWGHFNAPFMQIGLNKKLIYLAKDAVLRDILKHELAHYLTFIYFGTTQPHGKEFKEICTRFGFAEEISAATINLAEANLAKEGDLTSERVLEKVKKLLQLAQSSNPHEAELATLKANQLLLRHNLENLPRDEESLYLDRILIQKRKDAKLTAIYDILRHFIVKPVLSFGKDVCCLEVSGTLTNVKLARYVAEFLSYEMERLWEMAKTEENLQGLRAKNSFFLGIAKGFEEKMKISKSQMTTSDQKALVIVEKDLNAKVRQIYRRLSSSSSEGKTDLRAAEAGARKGKNLTIRQGVESSAKNLYLSFFKS